MFYPPAVKGERFPSTPLRNSHSLTESMVFAVDPLITQRDKDS